MTPSGNAGCTGAVNHLRPPTAAKAAHRLPSSVHQSAKLLVERLHGNGASFFVADLFDAGQSNRWMKRTRRAAEREFCDAGRVCSTGRLCVAPAVIIERSLAMQARLGWEVGGAAHQHKSDGVTVVPGSHRSLPAPTNCLGRGGASQINQKSNNISSKTHRCF